MQRESRAITIQNFMDHVNCSPHEMLTDYTGVANLTPYIVNRFSTLLGISTYPKCLRDCINEVVELLIDEGFGDVNEEVIDGALDTDEELEILTERVQTLNIDSRHYVYIYCDYRKLILPKPSVNEFAKASFILERETTVVTSIRLMTSTFA